MLSLVIIPIIDTTATRVVQNLKMDQLQSIPNGRDMWSLLAVTPAVQMTRIDVGGNRTSTQTGYSAYGLTGQVRVLIEGINTTEGTGGAGFYFDYSSLEEVFLSPSGPSAEMPNPGVRESVHRQERRQHVLGRGLRRLVQEHAPGIEHLRFLHGAGRLQQQPVPRRQQRDRQLPRLGDPHRRSDRAGQGVVVRHLPRAVQRGGAAELQLRRHVRHEALEPGRQGHLPRAARSRMWSP